MLHGTKLKSPFQLFSKVTVLKVNLRLITNISTGLTRPCFELPLSLSLDAQDMLIEFNHALKEEVDRNAHLLHQLEETGTSAAEVPKEFRPMEAEFPVSQLNQVRIFVIHGLFVSD